LEFYLVLKYVCIFKNQNCSVQKIFFFKFFIIIIIIIIIIMISDRAEAEACYARAIGIGSA
jgi:hypothetical protein